MSSLRIPTSAPSLIERGVELDALRCAVRGGGGVVVLDAAAGLGKTALLEEGAAMAGAAGWHVRRAAPSVLERGMPFGVLRALLEGPARSEPSVVSGAAVAAGELLLDGVSVSGDSGLMTMAHSTLWLCSALAARRPLALVVDDAQWADRSSLGVLAYIARRIEELPLLMLVATRSSCDVLSLLGGGRAAAVLHPAPLSAAGAARMIRRVRGEVSGTECRDLFRAARGKPWLLDVLAGGSAQDAVRVRLAELSADERAVADALAVVGEARGPHVLAAVAGVDVGGLAASFDALAFSGLVEDGRFVHGVVGEAIARDLPRGAREQLHRAAARALAAAGADARTVAAHLLECAPAADADVTRTLVAAADEARAERDRDARGCGAAGDDERGCGATTTRESGGTAGDDARGCGATTTREAGRAAGSDARGSGAATTREAGRAAGDDGLAPRGNRADEAVAFLRRALDEGAPGDDRGALLAALGEAAFDAGLPEACEWLWAAADEGVRTVDVVGRLAACGVAVGDSDATLDAYLDDPAEHARQVASREEADGGAGHASRRDVDGVAGREADGRADHASRRDADGAAGREADGAAGREADGAAGHTSWPGVGGAPGPARDLAPSSRAGAVLLAHRAWVALGRDDADAARLALAALADGQLLADARRRRAYELCARVLVATGHPSAGDVIAALREAATTVRMRAAATNLAAEHALRRGRLADAEALARTALAFPAPFDDGALALLVSALAERGAFADAHAALRSGTRDEDGCRGTTSAGGDAATAGGPYAAMARGGNVAAGGGAAMAGGSYAAMSRGGDAATGGGRAPVSVRHTRIAAARARLAVAEGEFAQALDHVEDGVLAAVALAHLGRRGEAARVADAALVRAERLGAPAPLAAAIHARALAEPDAERRVELCERGLAVNPGGLEAVRLRLELGAALAYLGRRVQARDALRPALADADRLGATALSGRARRELVATGLRPRQAALEGTASLTPRQRQICELAAVGKGNRVIAQELFLSIKTVETHLAAGYRKLGVNTRAALAAEFAQAA